ncbi:SDR family oxidoreductase [Rhodococcoides kyotonense]|uniref:Nucleoside-diphosphate-sugar epimerase n=1 Tax=Rhodococcoides kyotonense TaxID=398843 RepID=A0A239ILQ6_9NOCA|nr:SDR family oxidoreductase [Rhodococcus kyotonensis]SNS94600.1 Nucleoside-diphosphate-sugar epimerase [Rhodococcus kyotonensis]
MRVFVTGASGWIGSATVDELLAHGYDVTGLARSDASADSLQAKGATVLRGDLDDLDSLQKGSSDADAVIHLANKHDWANMAESNRAERAAVQTIGDALAGSGRPFLVASGVAGLAQGRPSTEDDASPAVGPDSPRGGTENLAFEYASKGVKPVALRFSPTVHGDGDHGFISYLVTAARATGVSGYVGDGSTGWAAVHRSDAARMIRLGLEKAPSGARLHAVGASSVSSKEIAEAIGRGLGLPVESIAPEKAMEHFGFIGMFFGMDLSSSSEITQKILDWEPAGPTLADDLSSGSYFR